MFAFLFILGYCYCIYWLVKQPIRQNLKSRTDRRLGLNRYSDSEIAVAPRRTSEEEDKDEDEGEQVAMLRAQPSS
jgi:hypothetical protein